MTKEPPTQAKQSRLLTTGSSSRNALLSRGRRCSSHTVQRQNEAAENHAKANQINHTFVSLAEGTERQNSLSPTHNITCSRFSAPRSAFDCPQLGHAAQFTPGIVRGRRIVRNRNQT